MANGCTEGQGYLFSSAIPACSIPALLDRESRRMAIA
jgi:EAL domain-containing protein (putative c-di-GMP-specific phosphodiesterase class I)